MKPNALRIGNIVTVNNPKYHPKLKDIPLLITGIYQRGGYIVNLEHVNQEPNVYYETYSQLIKYIEPIPITEELLLKLGFERNDSGHAEEHEDYHQWLEKVYPTIGCVCQGDGNYVFLEKFDDQKIYNLHQLQNIYHALMGEELNVEL